MFPAWSGPMNASNPSRGGWLKLTGSAGLASLSLTSGVRATTWLGGELPQAPVDNLLDSKQMVSLKPAGYWRLGEINTPTPIDWSGHEHTGVYHGSPAVNRRRHADPRRENPRLLPPGNDGRGNRAAACSVEAPGRAPGARLCVGPPRPNRERRGVGRRNRRRTTKRL
jgi:hypothetical protein